MMPDGRQDPKRDVIDYIGRAFSGDGPITSVVMTDRLLDRDEAADVNAMLRVDRIAIEFIESLDLGGVEISRAGAVPTLALTYGPSKENPDDLVPFYRAMPRGRIYIWFSEAPVGGDWDGAVEIIPAIVVAGSARDLGAVIVKLEDRAPGDAGGAVSIHDPEKAFEAVRGRLAAVATLISERNR